MVFAPNPSSVFYVQQSSWNFAVLMSRSWDISTSCLTAAILDFRLPVTSGSIRNSAIEVADYENVGSDSDAKLSSRRHFYMVASLHVAKLSLSCRHACMFIRQLSDSLTTPYRCYQLMNININYVTMTYWRAIG